MNSTPPIALLEHFLGLGRGVADVLADQVVARHAPPGGPCARSPGGAGSAAMRIATVVLPVPGLPVKHMCRRRRLRLQGRGCARSLSTTSSAAMSRMRRLDRRAGRPDRDRARRSPHLAWLCASIARSRYAAPPPLAAGARPRPGVAAAWRGAVLPADESQRRSAHSGDLA